jgi:hypothetical protein
MSGKYAEMHAMTSQVKKLQKYLQRHKKLCYNARLRWKQQNANSDRAECKWFVNKLQPISVGVWS